MIVYTKKPKGEERIAVREEGRPLHACVIVIISFTLQCFILQIVHLTT